MDFKSRRFFRIVRYTIKRFSDERGTESAASIAYYAIFSLFPLILVLIVIGSKVLESSDAQEQILEWVTRILPFAGDIIRENIQQVLARRSSVGLIGTLTLAWGATGVFSTLARNINRAWERTAERNFIKLKLMGLSLIAALIVFMSILLILNPILSLVLNQLNNISPVGFMIPIVTQLSLWLFLFGTISLLYYWIPNWKVRPSASVIGGIFSASAIELVTILFTFYLGSGLARYNLVYGSLGAIVALVFWIYLLSVIIIFGAHLTATLDTGV